MRITLLLIGATLVLTGCRSVSVSSDYDTGFDFARFRTFQWSQPATHTPDVNALIGQRIERAVNSEFEKKGYDLTSPPDFLVAIHCGKDQKIRVVDWGYAYGPTDLWGYHGYYRRGFGPGGISAYVYEQGTLVIDIIDAATNRLVWRGTGTGVVDPDPTPEEITESVNEAVAEGSPEGR